MSATRGIALLMVLTILTISALLLLAASRSALLHEMIAGQQSDQFRATSAAEALLRDAELDILGQAADGGPCRSVTPGTAGCRERGTDAAPQAPYFPQTVEEYEEVRAWLQAREMVCSAGICVPPDLETLATLEADLVRMQSSGATYGQFTRGGAAGPSEQMPRGWYWAEVLRYDTGPDALAPRGHLQPDPTRPFVYRITAIAHGLKPGTRAVVKTYFIPHPAQQLP